ncbi:MAG: PIG-L deacetylase family protein [Solirubrobacteraceae bacterium]
MAHPDDESLVAGGTLALAAAAGVRAGAVALTRGELGPISDPALATQDTLGAVREGELRDAATALGLAWSSCLGEPDGELEWADEESIADRLAEVLAADPPAVVLTFGADGLYDHPDHVAAGRIAALALGRVGGGIVLEAAWPPETISALVAAARERGLPTDLWGIPPEAFGSEGPAPTLVVDGTPVLARKLAAIRAHRSQLIDGHLLLGLPDDLALRFLAHEPWRLAPGTLHG